MEHAPDISALSGVRKIDARGSNQTSMRAYNERLFLSLLRQAGALPKVEIARRTGLSAQTVSIIMRELETDGLVERDAPVRGKVGQPSVPFRLARDGAFFFGLKIGRRSLELVLTDFVGEIRDRARRNHAYPTPDNTRDFAAKAIRAISDDMPPEHRARIAGLGLALPFQLWAWAGALGVDPAEMAAWRDCDITTDITAATGLPVFLCNDASAACGAELVFGTAPRPSDFLYIYAGYFIGGGLVLSDTLYEGSAGNAAALGSMPVPDAGAPGGMRQLVEVASLAALDTGIRASDDPLAEMPWDSPDDWTLPQDLLIPWLDRATAGIAHAILSSAALLDVDHVLLDGWMPAWLRAELVFRVNAILDEASAPGLRKPSVHCGSIGTEARALGAASLPLSKRFLIDRMTNMKEAPE